MCITCGVYESLLDMDHLLEIQILVGHKMCTI